MKPQQQTPLLLPHERQLLPLPGLFIREEAEEQLPTEGSSVLHQTHRYPAPITHKPHDNVEFK